MRVYYRLDMQARPRTVSAMTLTEGADEKEHDSRRSSLAMSHARTQHLWPGVPNRAAQTRIPSLDGARAVSIGLVVLGHAGAALPADDRRLRLLFEDRGGADLGVSVFFVLSGYLITRLLLDEELAQGKASLGAFYVRRAFRILPALYAYISFLVVANAVGLVTITLREFLAAATFTWNYHGGGWWLGHTWSLSIEEQFYVLWPAVLVLAGRRRSRTIALWIMLLEPFVRVGSYFAFPSRRGFIPVMGHTRMDVLLAGCLLALVEYSPSGKEWLTRHVTSRRALFAFLLLLLNVVLSDVGHGSYVLPIGYSVQEVSIAVLLLWAMSHADGQIGRVLNAASVRWLGRLSYSLYLWQQFFLARSGWIPRIFPFPVDVLMAIAAATASHELVEKPFLKLRDRVLEWMCSSSRVRPLRPSR